VTRTEGSSADDAHEALQEDALLRWYPRAWRARYGEDLIALLDDEYGGHPPTLVRLGLVTGGLRERARQAAIIGDSVPPVDGVRAGALMVLAAWSAFVVAGASFAKFSEHFDEALPHTMGAHRIPDLAFTVLQAVAGVASVLVVAGAILAAPAFARFLRAGGWSSMRGHFVRALACTAVTIASTVPLVVWAHHLTAHQRNSGLTGYGAIFLLWVVLIVITLTMWTVVAVAAARRVQLRSAVLKAEATLGAAVAVAMMVMVGATAVWWGSMAKDAPSFLDASPGGGPGSPWDLWLVATVALMGAAAVVATVGVVREARMWTRMRRN